jgi:hypothetical protein
MPRIPPPKPAPRPALARPPASDLPPPPAHPPGPVGAMPKDRMPGEPAGRIPTVMPRDWSPMRMANDPRARVRHAVIDNMALCGDQSAAGWLYERLDLSCQRCFEVILQRELTNDSFARHLRRNGIPVTRENYIDMAYPGDTMPEVWTAEHEEMLPAALRDWSVFEGEE